MSRGPVQRGATRVGGFWQFGSCRDRLVESWAGYVVCRHAFVYAALCCCETLFWMSGYLCTTLCLSYVLISFLVALVSSLENCYTIGAGNAHIAYP